MDNVNANANGNNANPAVPLQRPNIFNNRMILIEYIIYGILTFINNYIDGVNRNCPSPNRRSYLSSTAQNTCCPCGKNSTHKAYLEQAKDLTAAETSIARLQFFLKIAVLVASVLVILYIRKAYLTKAEIRRLQARVADVEEDVIQTRDRAGELNQATEENIRLLEEAHVRMQQLEQMAMLQVNSGRANASGV